MRYLPSSKAGKVSGALLLVFILIQLIPRARRNNGPAPGDADIQRRYAVPDPVMVVLKSACYDCHSNHTVYPWYSRVQPFALFLDNHIRSGKETLSFDEFGNYSLIKQQHKFESIREQVEQRDMPLASYTWMHRAARLTDGERKLWRIGQNSMKRNVSNLCS
jgi:hypothetical protein